MVMIRCFGSIEIMLGGTWSISASVVVEGVPLVLELLLLVSESLFIFF
jgi:hypothetical protein